jgi:hypothetical protein
MFEKANDGEMHPMQIRRKFVGNIYSITLFFVDCDLLTMI